MDIEDLIYEYDLDSWELEDAQVEAEYRNRRSPKLREIFMDDTATVTLHSRSVMSVARLKNIYIRAMTVTRAMDPGEELRTEDLFFEEEWERYSLRIRILLGQGLAFLSMLRLVPLKPINLDKSGTRRYVVMETCRSWPKA